MLILTLKLLLAHLLGDFPLQSNKMIRMKRIKRENFRLKALTCHIIIHATLLILVLQFNFKYWLGMVIIIVSHLVFDLAKLHVYDKNWVKKRSLFFIDQGLHLLVIFCVVYYYIPFECGIEKLYSSQNILLAVFILLITTVTSVAMKVLISRWKPKEKNDEALKNAGAYIGMLERLFIFGFILMNYWEGIGFLLAAKSVFRFGDLSQAKDRNLTEYILIGTLLSFGLAIAIAMGYNYLLEILNS